MTTSLNCEKLCAAAYFWQWTAMCFVAAAGGSNVKISSCHRYFPPPAAHSLDTAAHCDCTLNIEHSLESRHCTLNSGEKSVNTACTPPPPAAHSLDTAAHCTVETVHVASEHNSHTLLTLTLTDCTLPPPHSIQTLHTAQSHCALTEHTDMLRSPVQTALFTLCFQH